MKKSTEVTPQEKRKLAGMYGHFWYSQKMRKQAIDNLFDPTRTKYINFAELDSGVIVDYTLMNSVEDTHNTNWDDMVYLGHGKWHHNERI